LELKEKTDTLFLRHMILTSPLFFCIVWFTFVVALVRLCFSAATSMSLKSAMCNVIIRVKEKELIFSNQVVALQADAEEDCQFSVPLAA
jgi:hypothetical protein